jgi:NAD(P)-dependent dehydrogenase (short-subunit alcohol dehydrogenase family)
MNLEGRSAIITGGAGGFGSATARRLAAQGVGVVIFDLARESAESLAAEIGERAIAVGGDLNVDAEVIAAIEAAKRLGTFSIAITAHGAVGATPRTATSEGIPHDMESFIKMFEIHVFGTFNVCRLSAASFASNEPDADGQRGVIVNTASTSAFDGQIRQTAYGGAKAAIAGMTLPMARELGNIGVRVCCIAPGGFSTPMMGEMNDMKRELLDGVIFPKRFGHPDEYAMLAEQIVRNPYINAEVYRIAAGLRKPSMEISPDVIQSPGMDG